MRGLKVKWLVHPHRFPRLCSAESRAHLLLWLKGNKAAQDKPSSTVLQAIRGLILRSWDGDGSGRQGSLQAREAGHLGLAAPVQVQA